MRSAGEWAQAGKSNSESLVSCIENSIVAQNQVILSQPPFHFLR
jgi:hypothetical protein